MGAFAKWLPPPPFSPPIASQGRAEAYRALHDALMGYYKARVAECSDVARRVETPGLPKAEAVTLRARYHALVTEKKALEESVTAVRQLEKHSAQPPAPTWEWSEVVETTALSNDGVAPDTLELTLHSLHDLREKPGGAPLTSGEVTVTYALPLPLDAPAMGHTPAFALTAGGTTAKAAAAAAAEDAPPGPGSVSLEFKTSLPLRTGARTALKALERRPVLFEVGGGEAGDAERANPPAAPPVPPRHLSPAPAPAAAAQVSRTSAGFLGLGRSTAVIARGALSLEVLLADAGATVSVPLVAPESLPPPAAATDAPLPSSILAGKRVAAAAAGAAPTKAGGRGSSAPGGGGGPSLGVGGAGLYTDAALTGGRGERGALSVSFMVRGRRRGSCFSPWHYFSRARPFLWLPAPHPPLADARAPARPRPPVSHAARPRRHGVAQGGCDANGRSRPTRDCPGAGAASSGPIRCCCCCRFSRRRACAPGGSSSSGHDTGRIPWPCCSCCGY